MRLLAFLSILFLGTHCAFASAADWVEVAHSKAFVQYVDMDRLVPLKTGLVQFWSKSLIKDPARTFHGKYPTYLITKNSVDCQAQSRSAHLQSAYYDVFRNEIYADKVFFPKFSMPSPQSTQAQVLKIVCDCMKDERSHYECHSPERWATLSERLLQQDARLQTLEEAGLTQ